MRGFLRMEKMRMALDTCRHLPDKAHLSLEGIPAAVFYFVRMDTLFEARGTAQHR